MTGLDPAKVSVLAVGVERYADDVLPALPGTAAQAMRFARWALAQGVPAERIQVAASWVSGRRPRKPRGVQLIEATHDKLQKAVEDLATLDGELLLLFWCGHGLVSDDRRVLFSADAGRQHLRGLDAGDLLSYLRSKHLRGSFTQQMILIDACANQVEQLDSPEELRELVQPGLFPKGPSRLGVRQQVLFSAAQGQAAKYEAVSATTRFGRIVLDWLGKHDLPLNFEALHTHVTTQLDGYRDRGKLRQRPVSLWYRSGGGNEDHISYGGTPVSPAVQRGLRDTGLTVAQAWRVAYALADGVFGASEEGRRRLLGLFGVDADADRASVLTAAVRHVADGHGEATLQALIRSATDDAERLSAYEVLRILRRQHWIATPLRTFPAIRGEQVRAAYYRSVPPGDVGDAPQDVDEALDRAAAYGGEPGRIAVLHQFVADVEHLSGARVEDSWFELPADTLRGLRAEAAWTPTESARLVVDLRNPGRLLLGQEWPSAVDGHLFVPGAGWQKTTVAASGTTDGAREAIQELRDWAYQRGLVRFTVGLILTRRQLDEVPESWEFGDELYAPEPLWTEQPTIVHSAERLGHQRAINVWREQATAIREHVADHPPEVFWIPDQDRAAPSRIRQGVQAAGRGCVALGFVAEACPAELRRDPIIVAVAAGAPYVVWVVSEPPDWEHLRQIVKVLSGQGEFAGLPERLHQERSGPQHGLRVIWDEPEALPPLGQLKEPQTGGRQGV
ncbi:VMAP-C domain-containing protein [Actinoplanes aureus]|uniref:vWA-MoxR associated protein C-terminal domain-containing protein n=1 Tax=Actinoplanes aureus TaxID=2792083 RepID=A0A931G340_9ACTN|nr:caspase family protein [Actinoplanes aureus]MBG0568437.1 hypothetical protein [Actinoplanes aureus]